VQLVDCSHLIHAESLDEWVRGGITESRVQLPECPLCRTPIRRTQRYTSIINRHLGHVEKVKEKLRGEESSFHRQSVIKEIKAELKVQLAKKTNNTVRSGDDFVFPKKKAKFMGDLVRSVTSAEAALGVPQLRNCQQLLQSVCILTGLSSQSRPRKSKEEEHKAISARALYNFLLHDVKRLEEVLVKCLFEASTLVLTVQQMKEILQEVRRLENFASMVACVKEHEEKGKEFKEDASKVLNEMEKLFSDIWKPFTEEVEAKWEQLRRDLNKAMTGLGISAVEKRQVVMATGSEVTAWYVCSCGEIYAVGDCGRLNQTGRCPECNQRIGGGSLHQRQDQLMS